MASYNQYGIPILIFCAFVRSQELPSFKETYTAIGEVSATIADMENITMQFRFEEYYDFEKGRAVLDVVQLGKEVTFLEYFDSQQTFRYNEEGCKTFTPEDWITVGSPPDIKPYETDRGNLIFPLRQLINLTTSALLNPDTHTTFREIPAYRYKHRLVFDFRDTTTIMDIDSYWTDGEWNTSSKNKVVPLGFITDRSTYNKTSEKTDNETQYISIFYFAHGAVDLEAFKVREGVLCPGIKESIPFPNAQNLTVFSYSTEFQWVGTDSVSTADTWWDSKNRLLRVDFDPLRRPYSNSRTQFFVSDIISYYQGMVYRITNRGNKCSVSHLDNYEFDYQNIIDVKSEALWDRPITNFFGLEESSMIYIGESVKRGIPCSIWQGERLDWPSTQRPMSTVWEWCIANGKEKNLMQADSSFPLVNLEITILQSSGKDPAIKDGMKMIHQFYNLRRQTPGSMDVLAYDLFPCFMDNHIKLMFEVEYNSSLLEYLSKTVVSNPDFYALWKAEINHAAGLSPASLRIAQLRTMMIEKHLEVKFILLGVHPNLTRGVKQKEKSMVAAKQSLERVINAGNLTSEWIIPEKGKLYMKAIPNSLTEGETSVVTPREKETTQESSVATSQEKETTQESSVVTPGEKETSVVTSREKETTQESSVVTPGEKETTQETSVVTPREKETTQESSVVTPGEKETTHTEFKSVRSTNGTVPSITESEETEHPGLTSTESSTKTPTSKPLQKNDGPKRYSPGIMALVAIIMLVVGATIGASGTYYKIKKM